MNKNDSTLLGKTGLFGNTSESPTAAKEVLKKRALPKKLPDTGKKGSILDIPEDFEQRMNEEGYSLAWLRIYIGNGELDVKEIRKKENEGYTFVTRDEAPEMGHAMSSFFGKEIDKHGELILAGDVALAKIPTHLVKSREKALEDENRRRNKAIMHDLRRNQIGDPSRGDVYKTEVERPSARDVEFGE